MTTETLTPPTTRRAPSTPTRPLDRPPARHGLSQLRAHPADRPGLRLSGVLRAARGDLRPGRRRGHAVARVDRAASAGHLALPRVAARRRGAGAVAAGRLHPAPRRRPARPDPRHRPAVAQGRHPQPDPELQGPRRRDRRGPSRGVRRRRPRLRLDREPRRRDGRRSGRGRAARPTCSSRPISSPPRSITRWPTARPSCPIDGTYDDVNRLCLEVADETGWGFVNINLRPFYAEGSKTLAYEIAESLGWRTPGRDRRAGRVGRDVHQGRPRLRGARRARADRAPADPVRRRPGRRLRARRDGLGGRHGRHHPGPRARHVRPLAGDRQPGRRPLRGRARPRQRRLDRGDPGRGDRRGDPRRGPPRGHLPRDGRRRDARRGRRRATTRRDPRGRRGRRAAHRQRPQDARRAHARPPGRRQRPARPGQPGLAPVIRPSLSAFEAWLEDAS